MGLNREPTAGAANKMPGESLNTELCWPNAGRSCEVARGLEEVICSGSHLGFVLTRHRLQVSQLAQIPT